MSLTFANYKRIDTPEGRVKKITDPSGRVLWESSYINMIPLSTTSDGKTIYNGTGYKDGYRIRSGGAEASQAEATCTGFIPVTAGDVVGIGGAAFGGNASSNAINVSNASYTNLGQVVENYPIAGYGIFDDGALSSWSKGTFKNGCFYWTVPAGANIAFVRVTGKMQGNGSQLVVTINEEIA
jgi:hypothetical protein